MAVPLLAGGIKGLLVGGKAAAVAGAKNFAKESAIKGAKKFVTGKGKRKGKSKSQGQTTETTTAQTVEKDKLKKTKIRPKIKKVSKIKLPDNVFKNQSDSPSGTADKNVTFSSLEEQLKTINKTTKSLVQVAEVEKKVTSEKIKADKKQTKRDKAAAREADLESRGKRGGSGILGVLKTTGKSAGIFDFLTNIALGGLVLFLLNNYKTIESLFKALEENIQNPALFFKNAFQGLSTVFGGTIKGAFKLMWKGLKATGSVVQKMAKKLAPMVKKAFGGLGRGIVNFGKNIISRMKGVVTGGSGSVAKGAVGTVASQKSKALAKTSGKAATQKATLEAAEGTAKNIFGKKGAKRLLRIGGIFKRVPVVGGILSVIIDMLLGEPLDRAVVGAIGGGIGAWIGGGIGSLVFPFAGTAAGAILGSMIGDWAAKALYEMIKKKFGMIPPVDPKDKGTGLSTVTEEQKNQKAAEQRAQTAAAGRLGTDPVGSIGQLYIDGAKTTYYDPSLGGINASGYKTPDGLPATSTGEGYRPEVFSAAAFPPLLAQLPRSMTVPAAGFPGGRTLKKAFLLKVTNKDGKQAIIRVNDVGPGVAGHANNHMLDLSVAAKNYLGTGGGFTIQAAPANSTPGPVASGATLTREQQIAQKLAEQEQQTREVMQEDARALQQTTQTTQPAQLAPQQRTIPAGQQTLINKVPFSDFSRSKEEGGTGTVGVSSGYRTASRPNHSGIDIGTQGQKGYYVALKADGKVTVNQWGDKAGWMLFIKVGNLEYVFMHLARKSNLKVGNSYTAGTPIGEIGNTGRSFGEHLHFEVRPAGGGGGTGVDPKPYLKMLEIGKLGTSDGTQTQQVEVGRQPAPNQSASVSSRPSYDPHSNTEGGVIPLPIPGQQPMSGGGGGGGTPMMGGPSTQQVLNSYYKSQLMGFLYKQG